MSLAPLTRFCSVAALTVFFSSVALIGAGGGCSVDTSGLIGSTAPGAGGDPGASARGGLGGNTITTVLTGMGGGHDAGAGTDAPGGEMGGGAGAGSDGTGDGAGGASAGTGGAAAGTGGATVIGTGGTGVGGAPGIGGAPGVGGAKGIGGTPGTGGMGTGGSISVIGCADGTREAFINTNTFPSIAGCAGGWSVPGVVSAASLNPACARAAGNTGTRPDGNGCSVADLCAVGWHVCAGATELDNLNVTCANAGIPAAAGAATRVLYATRQRGVQGTTCNANDMIGTNDVHGCGNFGLAEDPNCAPLDHQFSHTECDQVAPWSCNDVLATTEGLVVVKPGSPGGGVLCCR